MRNAKHTAFRGWVAGAEARSRAFTGWVLVTTEHGQIHQLEGIISAVAEASGSLAVRHGLKGAVQVESATIASIIVRVGFPDGESAVRTSAEAALWLNQLFEGTVLVATEATGDFSKAGFADIYISKLRAEKDIVVIDAHIAGPDELSSEISVVGSVEAVAKTLDAILAEQEQSSLGATLEVKGGNLRAEKKSKKSASGRDTKTTKIDARR